MGWMMGSLSLGRSWEFFSSPLSPDQLWNSPNLIFNGHRGALNPGVKRPGREVTTHLHPPSSAQVKNAWGYTSISPICFHGVVFS